MLGLDAAGKTSEFLSCPKLVQDCYLGGLDIRWMTSRTLSWTDVRDGSDHGNQAGFERDYTYLHDPHFFNLPTPNTSSLFYIFPRSQEQS
jgi:hypothetical protein